MPRRRIIGKIAVLLRIVLRTAAGRCRKLRRLSVTDLSAHAIGQRAGRRSRSRIGGVRRIRDRVFDKRCRVMHQHGTEHTRNVMMPQRVASDSRIESDTQDNAVHLFRHADNACDEHDPRHDCYTGWRIGHGGQQHFHEHHIQHHERTHRCKHSQPAAENLCGAFRAAHCKRQRRAVNEYA